MKQGRSARRRQQDKILAASRLVLVERSHGYCEAAQGDICVGPGDQAHHVKRRSQGGDHEPGNLLWVCHRCHTWIHGNVAVSKRKGWLG